MFGMSGQSQQGQPREQAPQPMPKPGDGGGGIPNGAQFAMMSGMNNPQSPNYRPSGYQQYQSAIDDLQGQLMRAQVSGADPQTIAGLTMQLQQAQRAKQQAGYQALAQMRMRRPNPLGGVGSNRPGGGLSQGQQQGIQNWDANMQLLAQLWGLGGGGYGQIG